MIKLKQDCGIEVLKVGYKAMLQCPALATRITFTEEVFVEASKDLDVWGFYDEKPVGMLIFKGNSMHIAILKEYHGKCGKVLLKAFNTALKKHKTLIAEVHEKNQSAIHFVKKLGFSYICKNNDLLTYGVGYE